MCLRETAAYALEQSCTSLQEQGASRVVRSEEQRAIVVMEPNSSKLIVAEGSQLDEAAAQTAEPSLDGAVYLRRGAQLP